MVAVVVVVRGLGWGGVGRGEGKAVGQADSTNNVLIGQEQRAYYNLETWTKL